MRIRDMLDLPEPSFSFEFFPPKTDEGTRQLFDTVSTLRSLEPTFVSITWGAGGSTRERTLSLVSRIKRELSLETMAHLTCVGATADELRHVLEQLDHGGVQNVLCLRGDPPQGSTTFEIPAGGFGHAIDLVRLAREQRTLSLGVAGYPECHPESPDRYADLVRLRDKLNAGGEFVITQMFFDNVHYFEFVAQARRLGITAPIVPGIMPITRVDQVERITQLCGASIPERLRRELHARRDDPQAALEFGVAYATIQCVELLQNGAPGIHFYTLNRSSATRAILASLRALRPWLGRNPAARGRA